MGGKPIGSARRSRRRPSSPPSRGNLCSGKLGRNGGIGRYRDDSHRGRDRGRPNRKRACQTPQSAGSQCDWRELLLRRRAAREASRVAANAGSAGQSHSVASRPEQSEHSGACPEARKALHADGIQLRVLGASSEADIEIAFTTLARERISALLIAGDAFFTGHLGRIVALAERQRIIALYNIREFATAGGLMSYGASQLDAYRGAALYVGKILRGAKISDLPFVLPTKYELVINLRVAKALGVAVPDKLLVLADVVIE